MGVRPLLVLVGLVLLSPAALAQPLPGLPSAPSSPIPSPAIPGLESLDVEEGPFRFYGPATAPSLVEVSDPEGAPVLTYARHVDGTASLHVGDAVALDDLTLVRVDGSPLDSAF